MASRCVTMCSEAAAKAAQEKPQEQDEIIEASTSTTVEPSNELPLLTDKEQLLYRQKKKGKNIFKCIKTLHRHGKNATKQYLEGQGK